MTVQACMNEVMCCHSYKFMVGQLLIALFKSRFIKLSQSVSGQSTLIN